MQVVALVVQMCSHGHSLLVVAGATLGAKPIALRRALTNAFDATVVVGENLVAFPCPICGLRQEWDENPIARLHRQLNKWPFGTRLIG